MRSLPRGTRVEITIPFYKKLLGYLVLGIYPTKHAIVLGHMYNNDSYKIFDDNDKVYEVCISQVKEVKNEKV